MRCPSLYFLQCYSAAVWFRLTLSGQDVFHIRDTAWSGLAYWNDWMNGMYYLSSRGGSHLYTIQVVLNNINNDIMALMQSKTSSAAMMSNIAEIPTTTIRMSIAVIGILPILVLYPFFQRYFVKGITLGGVKE